VPPQAIGGAVWCSVPTQTLGGLCLSLEQTAEAISYIRQTAVAIVLKVERAIGVEVCHRLTVRLDDVSTVLVRETYEGVTA
jgi:hypothetical protein